MGSVQTGFGFNQAAYWIPAGAAMAVRSHQDGYEGAFMAALTSTAAELSEANLAPFWEALGTGALLGVAIECSNQIFKDDDIYPDSIKTSAVKGALTGAAITGATRLIRGAILLNTPSLPMEETIRRKKKRAGRR